jgi:hypothetical protein
MINYRELCESVIKRPPFSNAKKTNAIKDMAIAEINAYNKGKNQEVYSADNEKWHELWLEMQSAVYNSKSYMIGSNQFIALVSPLKYQIIGLTQ